ncbi:alpha/beta fold hydrolase [Actinokineospora sp. HUAS TT18]|uniref:alpha/beta fold hydrolase n=1 Tax=Actinokineospora sp. HUAS TT18 TaxID=3447451 RepID=UPI003F5251B2
MRGLSKYLRPGLRAAMPRSAVLTATERLGSVTHLVSSLEYLASPKDRDWGGPNNWDVTRAAFVTHSPRLAKALDLVARRDVTRALHVARVAAAAALWLPLPKGAKVAANSVLAGSQLALYARHLYGTDGADQVSFLVQALATVARIGDRRPALVDSALWFIALQSVLSYTVSGWAKLPSRTWRSGRALPGITRTLTYGEPNVWKLFERHPKATRLLAHGVLAMECGFPLVFAARGRVAPLLLGSAGAFHLANAWVMGLGRFFWSFTSTYPAVLYASGPRSEVPGERRDDTLPAASAALFGAFAATAQVVRARRAATVLAGRGDERTITAASGNVLSYRRIGGGDGPVVVLENGLCATAEHWEWITTRLAERFTTVTYHRAGYGPSRAEAAFSTDTAVADLIDLVKAVADGRPVVLIGHSLGGYLAMRAAHTLGAKVIGVGLVDSSHPAELRRSARQAQGADGLTNALSLMPVSLRAGLGILLQPPKWVDTLPAHVRELSLAQYRDHRLWSGAAREWKVIKAEFEGYEGDLPDVGAPMLVITAGHTAATDPVQLELHDEMAAAAPRAERHTVEDFDHDQLLSDETGAGVVAELVERFIDGLEEPDAS